jgi:enolase-phosphatase E1
MSFHPEPWARNQTSPEGVDRPLFTLTRIGRKLESASYQRISELMATSPESILFISDAISELEAASRAGLQVLFSHRPGNPQQDPGPYPSLASFSALHSYR